MKRCFMDRGWMPQVSKSDKVPLSDGAFLTEGIQRFDQELDTALAGLDTAATNRNPPTLNADPQGNIERTLKEAWLSADRQTQAKPRMVLCILPNCGPLLYGEIKPITDTVIGVPSHCLQSKFVADPKRQCCANISLKVNVKLCGSNAPSVAARVRSHHPCGIHPL